MKLLMAHLIRMILAMMTYRRSFSVNDHSVYDETNNDQLIIMINGDDDDEDGEKQKFVTGVARYNSLSRLYNQQ